VDKYSLESKQSAQKELDALDDAEKLVMITRIAHRREVYEFFLPLPFLEPWAV